MALTIRKQAEAMLYALHAQGEALKRKLTSELTTYPHSDITSLTSGDYKAPTSAADLVTADDGDATEETLVALANDLKATLNRHYADTVAHKVATTALSTPTATDLATAETLLNAIYSSFNTHIGSTTYHYTADGTNTASSASATDQGSSDTRADDLKAKLNAHIQFALDVPSIKLVDA